MREVTRNSGPGDYQADGHQGHAAPRTASACGAAGPRQRPRRDPQAAADFTESSTELLLLVNKALPRVMEQ